MSISLSSSSLQVTILRRTAIVGEPSYIRSLCVWSPLHKPFVLPTFRFLHDFSSSLIVARVCRSCQFVCLR
ncbi:hypothetical protein Csa_023605 [Cucumis sativus]|nr:hypothetical protein Csa_023605 [Cucumis sativus]